MNQTDLSDDTSLQLAEKVVLLALEKARVDHLKLRERRLIAAGRSPAMVKHLLDVAEQRRKNNFQFHPLYTTWKAMMSRCYRRNDPFFHRYGGKGVSVFDRWHSFIPFAAYIAVNLGERPQGKTLDRWPNRKGNYEPGNVRWATAKEQSENSDCPVLLEFNGKSQCLKEWSDETGIPRTVLTWRIQHHWPVEKVLNPVKRPKKPCCSHGHPYTEISTYLDKDGSRKCRICNMLRARELRLKAA